MSVPIMSNVAGINILPKEIRLQIWSYVYHAESPRLVALATKPHPDCQSHVFYCPRFSPSPAPLAVNICHESRSEAQYQASKFGELIRFVTDCKTTSSNDIYIRFDTDTLYIPDDDDDDDDDTPILVENDAKARLMQLGFKCGSMVENLAMDTVCVNKTNAPLYIDLWLLNTFSNLQRFVVVTDESHRRNAAAVVTLLNHVLERAIKRVEEEHRADRSICIKKIDLAMRRGRQLTFTSSTRKARRRFQ